MGVQDFFGVVGDVVDHLHNHVGVVLADHAGTILCDGGFERGDIGILGMLQEDAAKTEKEDEEALNDITSELTDLLAGLDLDAIGATPVDAEGEEE